MRKIEKEILQQLEKEIKKEIIMSENGVTITEEKSFTVNALLAMEKSLRERKNQLNSLASESSHRTIYREPEKTEEPTYDIKQIDKKITAINKALFHIDTAVKASNAKTSVNIAIDYDELVSELD